MRGFAIPLLGLSLSLVALSACTMPANDSFAQTKTDAMPYKNANATCFQTAWGAPAGGGSGQHGSAVSAYDNCMARMGWQRGTIAQTSGSPTKSYAQCRSEATGLSGDGLGAYIDRCVTQPPTVTTAMGERSGYANCRAAAIARGLSGEAQGRFVDRCLSN